MSQENEAILGTASAWNRSPKRYVHASGHKDRVWIEPDNLSRCPQLAEIVSRTIAACSRFDFNFRLAISEISGGVSSPVFQLLAAIGRGNQFETAVNTVLGFSQHPAKERLLEIKNCFNVVKIHRNRLAHGIFGNFADPVARPELVVFDHRELANNFDIEEDNLPEKLTGYIYNVKFLKGMLSYTEDLNVKLWGIYQNSLRAGRPAATAQSTP